MILDLRNIFKSDGSSLDIDCSLDFSDFEFNQHHPFKNPVFIKGTITNNGSLVSAKFSITTKTNFLCDRCLEEFEADYSNEFEHNLHQNEDMQEHNYIFAENSKLDLDELVLSDILLSLPYKVLCDEDCKGLCVNCGQNLNKSDCKCENLD